MVHGLWSIFHRLWSMVYGQFSMVYGPFFLSYTNLTMALLLSVELRNSWYFLEPAVMISIAVLGGMLPRFSATISISWKVFTRSIFTYTVIGFVDKRWCDTTTFLLTRTVIESPSTSALS